MNRTKESSKNDISLNKSKELTLKTDLNRSKDMKKTKGLNLVKENNRKTNQSNKVEYTIDDDPDNKTNGFGSNDQLNNENNSYNKI